MITNYINPALESLRQERGGTIEQMAGQQVTIHYMTYLPSVWNPRINTLGDVANNLQVSVLEIIRRASILAWASGTSEYDPCDYEIPHHLFAYYPIDLQRCFGQTLRHIRQNNGLSQEQLANRCRMDKSNISHRETGCTGAIVPTLKYIELLSEGLGITLLAFMQQLLQHTYELESQDRSIKL